MAFYDITPEQLDSIRQYAEGNGPIPTQEAITKFNALHAALNKAIFKDLSSSKGKVNRLEKRVQNFKKAEETRAAAGVFAETVPGLDSVDVAKALLYCLNQKQVYKMSKPKLIAILYEMYASWLASKHERLFAHHPQATEYGPHFWRVYKHVQTLTGTYEDFKKVAEQNAGIAAFCQNAAEKYYDWTLQDLTKNLRTSLPYKNAHKDNNNGKWGKEISDADIYAWKIKQQ